MYGIGILGCGRFAENHFRAYPTLAPRAKWVAACHTERSRPRLDEVCDEHDIPLRFTDVEEFAACDEVDVVAVVTPPHVRLEVIRPLLEAGKHVMVAKPFTEGIDEAREIVELADRYGCQLAVDQNARWSRAVMHMRELIEGGRIGTPTYAIINHCYWRDSVGWRSETDRLAMAIMGVHHLDSFRWLLLDEPAAVSCITAARPTLSSRGENETTAIVEFRNGAMATMTHSWSSRSRSATDFQQFDGPLGSIILRGRGEVTLSTEEGEESWTFEPEGGGANIARSVSLLLDSIESGQPPPHSGRDNLMTMALLDACYRSAEEKRRIEISPTP
jgi:predicted dehydrogenase